MPLPKPISADSTESDTGTSTDLSLSPPSPPPPSLSSLLSLNDAVQSAEEQEDYLGMLDIEQNMAVRNLPFTVNLNRKFL